MDNLGQQPFPIEKSSYYSLWMKEKHEIEVLKWLLSEKAGLDVGMDYATWAWVFHGHRQKWIDGLKKIGRWPPV